MTSNARAQVAPSLPEHILPPMIYTPAPPIYDPYFNSAYSYFNVPMFIGTSSVLQDLYVYTWTGNNFFNSGLAWIRRDPNTDAILDQGYFNLPQHQSHHEVGIVNIGGKIMVALTYINKLDNNAAMIQFHDWSASGVSPFPGPTYNIRAFYPDASSFGVADRITMDCINLNKIVVAWSEQPRYDLSVSPPSTVNRGGIYIRAIDILPTGTIVMGNTNRLYNTDSTCVAPDVALGSGGDSVHVAYIRKDNSLPTPLPQGNIEVQSDGFSNILGSALLTPITSFVNAFTGAAVTNLITPSSFNHLRIDAPDHMTSKPIWSLVYMKDHLAGLNAVTVDPLLLTKNIYYNILGSAGLQFCTPVVTYSSGSDQYVALGWYNPNDYQYQAARLTMDGTTLIPYGSATTNYFIVNNVPTRGNCSYAGKMSFSTSQQTMVHKYHFLTYPINDYLDFTSDMRSKIVRWGSTYTYSEQKKLPTNARISPNPLTLESAIYIDEEKESIKVVKMIDVLGREVWRTGAGSLLDINTSFSTLISQLSAGNYIIVIQTDKDSHVIKVIKN